MKMADAKQKRNEQLKRWLGSETDLEPPILKKKKTKVKFDDGAVFLAACSSGDTEEVLRLLDRGADINYANVDGLTALHQACIDDTVDMVMFLVQNGANINQPDNEGWIPLHAAASCGYMDIAKYLISHGANVGVVNSEGETPLDIAEEEAMEELLQNEINRQGVDIEAARKEEERVMLRDARQWLNSGQIADMRHTKSGGTAMHVAAAKGYAEVLKLLIQAGYDVNIKDFDGWTPLHAAAHWAKEEACRILVESLCDMDTVNKVGQTAFDVADEDVLGHLEELQKKQSLLSSEKQDKKSRLIDETTNKVDNTQPKPLNPPSKNLVLEPLESEKMDEEEEVKKDESSCSSEEEEEEDSESETEADKSKTPAPTSTANSSVPASVMVTSPTSPAQPVTPTSPIKKFAPAGGKTSSKDESPSSWRQGLRKTDSYGALSEITAAREAQRKEDLAGVTRSASSPRLSSTLDNKDKEKDKGTRFAYIMPTIPSRRSTTDMDEKENRDSPASLVRSSSYTRRRWDDDGKSSDTSTLPNRTPSYQRSLSHTLTVTRSSSVRDVPTKSSSATNLDPNSCNSKPWQLTSSLNQSYSIPRSSSFGRRQDDGVSSGITSPATTSSVTSPRSLVSGLGSRSGSSSRFWSEEGINKEKEPEKESAAVIPTIVHTASVTSGTSSTTGTITSSDSKERRRSYLTPVRDEESESQRRARSRQARQSRRSTQGVTLTDLQEAEKTIGRSRPTRTREDDKEEKQDKEKQEEKKEPETKEDDYRWRYRSLEERYRPSATSSTTSSTTALSTSSLSRPNSLSGITSPYSRSTREGAKEGDRKDEEKEAEDKSQPRSIRERRRPREKRRSTGMSFSAQDSDENDLEQQSDSEDGSSRTEPQSDRLSRNDCNVTTTSSTDRYDHLNSRGVRQSYLNRLEKEDTTDYKKLYIQILAENEKLKAQLRDTNLELADLKLQLEKATQRQERFAERSQLEMERREKRALERKISDMEEELKNLQQVKQVQALRKLNEQLVAENRALARVVARLTESCSQPCAADS
ncbi:protein phosphatase 1 regulatory subunit 12A isoform X3 [Paramormyrops kingsleyae]|uniref:protein phosphatase 1 regulatory subunit 12A isoform X3 n=1 Tax=Paramormyrops kingsleyae TaxID=1676925 RepID=UPI000CD6555F|nr:protein phosphatase 1 regulatory subunit 12A-like isoform X1 [Paramormyrops kingsleyae]